MSLGKLKEAKRLYKMGFGIHWLKVKSKVPVKPNWTNPKRDKYETIKNEYKSGNNIGTKLGTPSKTDRGYLAVLDVDVKSSDTKHRGEAERWVKENFPNLLETSPITRSGRGNGSRHIWFLVPKPIDSRALYSSPEIVEVMMPSAKPTKAMVEKLGQKKIDQGWRLRPAWEVDFMCEGRQVVLPPSIHPDSGKEYRWSREFTNVEDVQVIDIESKFGEIKTNKKSHVGRPKNGSNKKLEIVDVEDFVLERELPTHIVMGIYDGLNVSDRSAFCLSVALSMVVAGFKDSEIYGVLTNSDFFIGSVAFEHAQTKNRQRAARWVSKYCIPKARQEADATYVFTQEVEEYETVSKKEAKKQVKRMAVTKRDKAEIDWKKLLDRTDKDKLKTTFKNIKLILHHDVGDDLFIRDAFANRDLYGMNTPWGGVKGELITDDDCIRIKDWFSFKYRIEPSTSAIFEAMVQLCTENSFHPVRDYLMTLEWDGVPRINTWIKDYLGGEAPEPYLSSISRKFLVAAIARIFNAGVKFDQMLIFQGKQGVGKSSVGSILASKLWFSDDLKDLNDKDSALNLQGQWVVEMGELSQMRKQEVEVVKSFITREVDKVRPPYGKRMIEVKRQCVFFGTTNADVYLKDKTGNRRFWPVEVHGVDFKGLKKVRDQLWAEAMFVYDNTVEELYLTGEELDQAVKVQESKMVEDLEDTIFSKLSTWLNKTLKIRKQREIEKPLRIQVIELFEEFTDEDKGQPPLGGLKADNWHLQMVGSSLRKLGFKKISIMGKKYWKFEA